MQMLCFRLMYQTRIMNIFHPERKLKHAGNRHLRTNGGQPWEKCKVIY